MGTIDEAIIQARIQLIIWEGGVFEKLDNTPYAVETLVDIAEKYQKIQEVMDSRPDDDAKSNSKALGEIEVIMYGNDN